MEKLAKRYRGRAEFVVVYGRESHPDSLAAWVARSAHPAPLPPDLGLSSSPKDCAARARFFRERLKVGRPVLVDEYGAGNVHVRLGGPSLPQAAANEVYVIGRGRVLLLRLHMASARAVDDFLRRRFGGGAPRAAEGP